MTSCVRVVSHSGHSANGDTAKFPNNGHTQRGEVLSVKLNARALDTLREQPTDCAL